MANLVLEVVGMSESRKSVPIPVGAGEYTDVAIGTTMSELYLKSPSGKTYVVAVPTELYEDLFPA